MSESVRLEWHKASGCFVFIVDCQPVQRVLCGHSPLLAAELPNTYQKIADNLGQVLDEGWQALQPWGDPVIWGPRGENVTADFLANYTMDTAASWSKCFDWPFAGRQVQDCNFVIRSDGGTRCGQCSAAAWVVDVGLFTEGCWDFRRLGMGGTFMPSPISSFSAVQHKGHLISPTLSFSAAFLLQININFMSANRSCSA